MALSAASSPIADVIEGRDFRMLVGGELVEAEGGRTAATKDPSTGHDVARVPDATRADVDRAVRAARAAQPAWEALGIDGRAEVFARLHAAIEKRFDELALVDAIDSGNPYEAMRNDLRISLQNIRDWPALVRWHGGRTIPASPHGLHYTSARPYGVVGRILAFNHPLMFAVTRPLCALLAGNTVVMKPSDQTPLGALAFAEVIRDVFPAGVWNVVTGGVEPGDALVTHPDVRRIGFTGSVGTGLTIARRAAEVNVKHLSLELGGKNPMLVFPDADLDAAVTGALLGMNFGVCQGQSCGSNSRVYVHRDLYEDFLARAGERLEAMRVAPAYAEGTDMGPLVTDAHLRRVLSYVEAGREQGARLVTGGERPNGGSVPAGGYYLRPTLFADVTAEMRIAREEIFGPVLSVAAWEDYEDVLAQANGTELGLTASVWTNDLDVAHVTADRLEAGYVWINDSSRHFWGTPFGGWKDSGTGVEESIEEYESYLRRKVVHTMLRDPAAAVRRMTGR
jgi:acyl-CoA reductase-like NAD-dependent aldehyde dehydrogenase